MAERLKKNERAKEPRNFVMTERDLEVLKAVSRYRYLRTGQIKRLLFPDNADSQAVRKRLRHLYDHGLLGRLQPYVRIGEGADSDTAYYLEKAGREYLQGADERVTSYAMGSQVKNRFLHHALDVSEFRLALELALRAHPHVELARFTADFELRDHPGKQIGNKRYRYLLYNEVKHPRTKESYVVHPDALVVLSGKGEFAGDEMLYFAEIDRGTEGLNVVKDKVVGYWIYHQDKLFERFGRYDDFRVLLQTTSAERAKNIRHHLTDVKGAELIWITDEKKVRAETIISAPIWQDHELKMRAIVKG